MNSPTLRHLFYLLLALPLFVFTACKEERQFSEQEPYSVTVQRYRNYQEAINTLARVRDRGLHAYIVSNYSEEEGLWFSILISAAPDLEVMMEQKIQYEDNYGIKELKIVNYNKMKESFMPIREGNMKGSNTTALRPGVGFEVHDLLKELPNSTYYRPVAVKIFHPSDSFSIYNLSAMRNIQADLPRGISQTSLLKNAKAMAEVMYEDDLSYQKLTIQMVSLKEDNVYGDSIDYYFSKKVLDTREYEVEEIKPVSFGGRLGLKGYMVTITPNANSTKRYLILLDNKKQQIVFIQSGTNNEKAMRGFAELVGETAGLQKYASFHNSFYTLPRTLPLEDHFVYFESELQRDLKGSSAALREGHFKSRFIMNTENRGTWEITLYTASDLVSSQKLFDILYKNTERTQKDSIQIFGQHGWLTTSRRIHPVERKYQNMPNEIQFATDKFICIFSNKNRAWLSQEELESRARAGQFIVSFQELEKKGIFGGF